MKIKKVTRYYCDFCGRGHFYKNKCLTHEAGCTANPNRVCNVCIEIGSWDWPKLKGILDTITNTNKDGVLMALQLAANHCPACIFAALRQHPKTSEKQANQDREEASNFVHIQFDIKKAWADWQHDEAAERREWRFGTTATHLTC